MDSTTPTASSTASKERYRSAFRPGLFEGQTVVVTGGGSGLGRCAVHELASLGAHVAVMTATHHHPIETSHPLLTSYEDLATEVGADGKLTLVRTAG